MKISSDDLHKTFTLKEEGGDIVIFMREKNRTTLPSLESLEGRIVPSTIVVNKPTSPVAVIDTDAIDAARRRAIGDIIAGPGSHPLKSEAVKQFLRQLERSLKLLCRKA